MKKIFLVILIQACFFLTQNVLAQPDRWQQRVRYEMDIKMDVVRNQFTGKQKLEYTNNSPDTLFRVFYHLYFNAFQPNSMMDMRSRESGKININGSPDWDQRIRDRIQHLQPNEIGYQKVLSLKMNGVAQNFKTDETILEVKLNNPILPRSKVIFDMDFEAQVPLQIRRSGRDNPETGVRYSMSQWYPKLCEYDREGWHPTPYVGREFYGVWGDFDVKITIDKKYVLGGTGYLQNNNEIGNGYESPGTKVTRSNSPTLTWRFVAPNVHDFMWAADPDYKHVVRNVPNGPTIHVLYKTKPNNPANDAEWTKVADAAVQVLPFIEKNFGEYPYKQYSFIQGGDGGMEYPMSTLLSGPGLQGNAFHEWMHNWYQGLLGTNESEYAWMDEGFTTYADALVSWHYDHVFGPDAAFLKKNVDANGNPVKPELPLMHAKNYNTYFAVAKSELEEPLSTHADHFEINTVYKIQSYIKGEVFLEQLGYITGSQVRDKILLEYYRLWRYKHPDVNDFIQVAEKASNMKLDWYREYWVNTIKTIDYGIDSVWEESGKTKIRLKRSGKIPMPIDLQVSYKDGSKEIQYIPLDLMFGEKPVEDETIPRKTNDAWKWTHPNYTIEINKKLSDVKAVEIDPTKRMADINSRDNKVDFK